MEIKENVYFIDLFCGAGGTKKYIGNAVPVKVVQKLIQTAYT